VLDSALQHETLLGNGGIVVWILTSTLDGDVISFKVRPSKSPMCLLMWDCVEIHSKPGCFGQEKYLLPLAGTESRFWSFNPQPSICRYWAKSALCNTLVSKCVLMPELNSSLLKKTLCVLTSIVLNTALVELASGRLFCRSLMTLTPCAFTCSGLRKAFSMFLCHSRVERGTITFLT
jgi:hypothetical protein